MNENDEASNKRAAQEHLLISKLTREDLEDKYLKNYDENIILKKHARKQEDRIKKMATKLVRLVNDKKKSLNTSNSGKQYRDIETEEYIADLEAKVSDLDMINKRLKENLQSCRMQLQTLQAQKNSVGTVYNSVTARIDTGLLKRDPSLTKNMRTLTGNLSSRSNNNHPATFSSSNIISNNNNNANYSRQIEELESDNSELKARLEEYEAHVESLNEKLRKQNIKYEEVMHKLKNQVSQDHITGVQENIDQIRMQRELKDRSNQYSELFSKFNYLSQNHEQLKENHDRLLDEIERYNQQIKQEQQRNISLKTEIKNMSQNNRQILELKGQIDDLQKELETLKDANQKLLTSAFSVEREREFRERERALKIQIAQLEATLKSDVSEKGSILDRLTNERDQYDKLNTEMRDMQVKYYEMKQKYDDMNEKMMFLSKESQVDFREIEEALIIVKDRKSNKITDDPYLNKVDAEKIKLIQRKTIDLEAHLAETIAELEKSRHLLITQVKINDDYKKEVLLIQNKMEENKSEFDAKTLEYAQLLDLRAARIKKLERQLNDIAYGTRQVKITPDQSENKKSSIDKYRRGSFSFVGQPSNDMLDHNLIANLERGQNIFEIHLTKLTLSDEAIRILNEIDPSTFCTIEFFEHELQTTPVVKGRKPEYNFTSQYIIKVDDFFLHYLQKETTTIELHQAIGSDYTTKAACQISFRELIDKQIPRLHGVASLLCVSGNNMGVSFGTIEYWARLIVPVDEAFRLYKERTKALGYLSTNKKAANQHQQQMNKETSANNMNELKINVLRCAKINLDNRQTQPSPYCVYKFYDFTDHDTEIIAASNYPEFNDHKSFAVPMDMDLDKYLKKESLEIYVFDDNEPETSSLYLGMAKIPLISLAHDNDIKGTFELKQPDGKLNGTIDVTFYWQYSYLPPTDSTFSASGSKQPINNKKKNNDNDDQIHLTPTKMSNQSVLVSVPAKAKLASPSQSSVNKLSKDFNNSRNSSTRASPNMDDNNKKADDNNSDNDSIGNATIHGGRGSLPEKLTTQTKKLTPPPTQERHARSPSASPRIQYTQNTHYNDTIFGDEQKELDSIRSNYQNNLTNVSDDEKDNYGKNPNEINNGDDDDINDEIENEINEDLDDDQQQNNDDDDDDDFADSQKMKQNYMNYTNNNSTGKSDDGLVVGDRGSWDPNNTSDLPKQGNEDCVIIEISNFSFKENSNVLKRKEVKKLFVGMTFLNYDPADLESKSTMPKPKANEPVFFNFRKIFKVDSENNIDKRKALARMLLENEPSFFSFAVVAEPDSDEEDCEDIGYSYVDIQDLMKTNSNYYDKELSLFDANNENIVIGKIVVTVEMIDALNAIKQELIMDRNELTGSF